MDSRIGGLDYRRTFRSAAIAFADLVSRIPPERLDGPGLGEWTLRELLGHTASSALLQVPAVLANPAPQLHVPVPEGYFAMIRMAPPAMVEAARTASTDDARATATTLGDEPVQAVSAMIGKATSALAGAGDEDLVATPAGGMRVRDWLPTRTFELVVHGSDAATAAGLPVEFDPEALGEAAALAARVAALVGDGLPVLRALTGRTPLPPTFTIL